MNLLDELVRQFCHRAKDQRSAPYSQPKRADAGRKRTWVAQRLNVERVALPSRIRHILDPLYRTNEPPHQLLCPRTCSSPNDSTHERRIRNHHVAVHEDVRDGFVHAREDGRTQRDVGHKVSVEGEQRQVGEPKQQMRSRRENAPVHHVCEIRRISCWALGRRGGAAYPCGPTLRRAPSCA